MGQEARHVFLFFFLSLPKIIVTTSCDYCGDYGQICSTLLDNQQWGIHCIWFPSSRDQRTYHCQYGSQSKESAHSHNV